MEPAPKPAAVSASWPAWLPWLLGRCASGVATIWLLSLLVFVATQALPSDPARVILGPDAPEATVQLLARQLGFDRPITEQYVTWVGRVLRGELGTSVDSGLPVTRVIGARLGNTLFLLVCVLGITLPLALLSGVFLACRRDTTLDRIAVATLVGFKAIPTFAVAIALVMLFATTVFQLLPAVSLLDEERPLLFQLELLALPTVTLVLSSLPYPTRLVRASMIEALQADHVVLARLRGIPERRILFRHALPNALVPAIQGTALLVSSLFGGSVIVEVLFNYPGLGSLMNASIELRDVPVIQSLMLLVVTAVVAVNLIADLLNIFVTPRLRTATTGPLWRGGTPGPLRVGAVSTGVGKTAH